jgi:hypothetical protein
MHVIIRLRRRHSNLRSLPLPMPMSDDQAVIEWVGGAWDGRTLTIPMQLALTLLGRFLECPSTGAPFMILADMPTGPGRILSYQADNEVSENGVLYLRALVPTSHC